MTSFACRRTLEYVAQHGSIPAGRADIEVVVPAALPRALRGRDVSFPALLVH